MTLLLVKTCAHGNELSIIALPEGTLFTDPGCARKDGVLRQHVATRTLYRVATEEDMYVRPVPRKRRSDAGTKRGPRR